MPEVFKHLYFKMALDFAKTGNIGATALNFLSNAGFKKNRKFVFRYENCTKSKT